jgi:putative DNA primase/helicase
MPASDEQKKLHEDFARITRKQLRMAHRMAAEHGDDLRYVHKIGWHVWRGGYWAPDMKDTATLTVIHTRQRAMADLINMTGNARDELYADARLLDMSNNIQGVVKIAKALPPFAVSPDDLDPDSYAVNMPDGVYDLRTGTLREHDRAVLHTKITGTSAQGARSGGMWDQFLGQVLPDPEVRRFAQKVAGYALLGKVMDQIFPIVSGEGGTGKSTFLEVLLAAFGSYGGIAPTTLLLSTGTREQHPTEIARLRGRRLVVVHETEKSQVLKAAKMKEMTGKDKLVGRFMREDFFEFTPSHTFMLVTNYPPTLDSDDDAAWDRIKVIPFTQKFRGTASENTNLSDEIIASDLPAVMRWLLDGYALYETEGLQQPEAVLQATHSYHVKVDTFTEFLDEHTERVEGACTPMGPLTQLWTTWAKSQGIPPGKPNDMHERLIKRGFEILVHARPRVVVGLKVTGGWSAGSF